MASRCTPSFAEYKVGEISQALFAKNTAKNPDKYGNEKLDALFRSARLLQPGFLPVTHKVRGRACWFSVVLDQGLRDRWSSTSTSNYHFYIQYIVSILTNRR